MVIGVWVGLNKYDSDNFWKSWLWSISPSKQSFWFWKKMMIPIKKCFWYVIPIGFMGLVYLVYHKNELFMQEIYRPHGSYEDMIGCRMFSKNESFYTSEDPQQWLQTTTIHKVFMLILESKKATPCSKQRIPGNARAEHLLLNLYIHMCDCVCVHWYCYCIQHM